MKPDRMFSYTKTEELKAVDIMLGYMIQGQREHIAKV